MKGLDKFLNEKFDAKVNSLKDLLKAIKKLPDTIRRIDVPVDLLKFASQATKVIPKDNKDWKKEVESILKSTLKGKGGKDINSFKLNSYTGRGAADDSYYIALDSKESIEFADSMGKGKGGSLD
tara:strand:+ start:4019 stop:4390 length:372 start_codon:yes stop_codon:yes gene_type:complete